MIHDGFRNRYWFVKENKKVTLVPLTPKQVYEDQLKLKRESEAEISKRKERKKERKDNENASESLRKGEIQKGKIEVAWEKSKEKK